MTWRCCDTAGWAGVRAGLRALDAGLLPPHVQLRPRPPTRRGRLQVPDRAGGTRLRWSPTADASEVRVGWSTSTTRSSRSTATPSRARATATPASADSTRCSPPSPPPIGAGGRGPTAPQGIVRLPARREAAGRRRLKTSIAARPARRLGAGRLRVLRPRHGRCRHPCRCRCLGHRADGSQGQGRNRQHRRRRLDSDRVHRRGVRRTDQTWVSRAEVAEIGFTAFTSKKTGRAGPGRLVVRRIPDLNPAEEGTGSPPCSTPGGSTPSSPPPTRPRPTRWPRTRPTVVTRSSSRSTPT